jgi:hypothetical protein
MHHGFSLDVYPWRVTIAVTGKNCATLWLRMVGQNVAIASTGLAGTRYVKIVNLTEDDAGNLSFDPAYPGDTLMSPSVAVRIAEDMAMAAGIIENERRMARR